MRFCVINHKSPGAFITHRACCFLWGRLSGVFALCRNARRFRVVAGRHCAAFFLLMRHAGRYHGDQHKKEKRKQYPSRSNHRYYRKHIPLSYRNQTIFSLIIRKFLKSSSDECHTYKRDRCNLSKPVPLIARHVGCRGSYNRRHTSMLACISLQEYIVNCNHYL